MWHLEWRKLQSLNMISLIKLRRLLCVIRTNGVRPTEREQLSYSQRLLLASVCFWNIWICAREAVSLVCVCLCVCVSEQSHIWATTSSSARRQSSKILTQLFQIARDIDAFEARRCVCSWLLWRAGQWSNTRGSVKIMTVMTEVLM